MYGITKDTQEVKVFPPMPTGINENIILDDVFMKEINDSDVLCYRFVNPAGSYLEHLMFPVDKDRTMRFYEDFPKTHSLNNKAHGFVKGEPIKPRDGYIIELDNFNSFNKHIVSKFAMEDEIIESQKDVSSYKEFCQSIINLIEGKEHKKVKLRLLVILNNKDYTTLPKYPPFIELQTDGPTSLKINTKYHKLKPDAVANDDPHTVAQESSFDNTAGFDYNDEPKF